MIRWTSYELGGYGRWRWIRIGRLYVGVGPRVEAQPGPTLIVHWADAA